MTAYIIRRVIIGVIILILVTMIVFLFVRLLPGDPLIVYMASFDIAAQTISEEGYQHLLAQFGLDKPIPVQYVNWLWRIFHGDLGESIKLQEDITTLMADVLPRTAYLGAISMVIGTSLGILFGIIVALRRGTWTDNVITLLANVGITIPQFWLGILLIYLFAHTLHWLPTHGWTPILDDPWLHFKQIIMPVICLSVGGLSGHDSPPLPSQLVSDLEV